MFGAGEGWWSHNIAIVLNATELYILKWFILYHTNFTPVKTKQQGVMGFPLPTL